MNRRELVSAFAASGIVIADQPAEAVEPDEPITYWTAAEIVQLPSQCGPITGMTVFRDRLYVATKYGRIFEIHTETLHLSEIS